MRGFAVFRAPSIMKAILPPQPWASPSPSAARPFEATDMSKTIRVAFAVDVTGFDPQAPTTFSAHVNALFGNLYGLTTTCGRRVCALLAEAMPEISADGRCGRSASAKGVRAADDPVFRGKEAGADGGGPDLFVEAHVTRRWSRQTCHGTSTAKVVGADGRRSPRPMKTGKFDYESRSRLKAIDRYTVQMTLKQPDYILVELMQQATGRRSRAGGREAYRDPGGRIMNNPGRCWPLRHQQWIRGNKLHLVRTRTTLASPLTEAKPRKTRRSSPNTRRTCHWLATSKSASSKKTRGCLPSRGRTDYEFVGNDLIGNVVQNGKLAPDLAAKGVRHQRAIESSLAYDYFSLDDPIVGGRRPTIRFAASRMSFPTEDYVRVVFRNPGRASQPDHPADPDRLCAHKPNLNKRDVQARQRPARPLWLRDVDGGSYREMPDGKPF